MKLRRSIGTTVAAAAGVLALTAAPALAAAPVAHTSSATAAARTATHLTLKSNVATTTAGNVITLTAHLSSHGANRTVALYSHASAGGAPVVIAKGIVDAHGNLVVRYHDYQNRTFWAVYAGDTTHAPSTSAQAYVSVAAKVTASLGGYYTSTSWNGHTVRVFHTTTDIIIKGLAGPNKGFADVTIQAYSKGTWYNGGTQQIKVAANGVFSVNTGKDDAKGVVFRVLVSLPATTADHAGNSGWLYLTAK